MTAFGKNISNPDWHRYNGGAAGDEWRNRTAPDDAYFVFSVVRNPFDRLISGWKYLRKLRDVPLEEVLRALPGEGHGYRHLTQTQVSFLRDLKTGFLATHDLIRYERLQEDFDRICDLLGKPRMVLATINISRRVRDYRTYYDPVTRAMAAEHFAEDLAAFGYDF